MKRRDFFTTLTSVTAGLALAGNCLGAETETPPDLPSEDSAFLRVGSPQHGAILHQRLKETVLGQTKDAEGRPLALKIIVRGEASPDATIKVDGVTAKRDGRFFSAEIELKQKKNEILVTAQKSDGRQIAESRVCVWWLKNSVPRYRFTVDDTIYFLREIHRKQYKSLFDDEFLGRMRDMNRKYGTKIALNLFYESEDGFTLSDFSDRYRSEWRDNADWLRLLFHAKREFPGSPYQNSTPQELAADFVQVENEIKRFAGEESYLPTTVIHFGDVRPDTYKTLAEHGVTTLSGYFNLPGQGTRVNYQMDEERTAYLNKRDFLLDVESGIVFSKIDLVFNLVPLDQIVPTLEAAMADPNTAEFIDLLTHEQYFWPFYVRYLPDHWDRLDRGFALMAERGYKPVFLNDPLLGVED